MFCNYCGQKLPDDAVFCNACGKAVAGAAQPGTTPGATPGPAPAGANQPPKNPYRNVFIRPQVGRKFKGVCLAVANYLDVDVTLIRVIWVVMVVWGGSGIIAYLIGWLCIDEESEMVPVETPRPEGT